ncbi:hypothetical protein AX16_007402, partial [Volvariella volvacea WC 439]
FSKSLIVRDKNKNPLLVVCTSLEDKHRAPLLNYIEALYPNTLQDIPDSTNMDVIPNAEAIHFSWYNRYSDRGDETTTELNPFLLKPGERGHINPAQFVPRSSAELKQHREEYEALQSLLTPLFEWQKDQIKSLLPDIFQQLKVWPDSLPLGERSPVYPFGGFVLNFNTCTRIHRDHSDDKICTVIPITMCEGGELCFFELGLVLKVETGDMAAFKSADISHFNLPYQGKRASLVSHSDAASKGWIKDANGWLKNRYFQGDELFAVF